jgi:hypothetical protein
VALLASGHAAMETDCEIGIADVVEDFDDLLLGDICHSNFAFCRHDRSSPARNVVSYVGQKSEIVLVRWITKINRQHCMSVEILFLADRPVATGLKMKKGLNVVEYGVVLVVRRVDNCAYSHAPIYVAGTVEPDFVEIFG